MGRAADGCELSKGCDVKNIVEDEDDDDDDADSDATDETEMEKNATDE